MSKQFNSLIGKIGTAYRGQKFVVTNDWTNLYGVHIIRVKFIEPNIFGKHTIREVSATNLRKLDVKDIYAPSVRDIACIGDTSIYQNEIWYRKLYRLWNYIISKKKNNEIELIYKWLCFEYFINDCMEMNNWNKFTKEYDNMTFTSQNEIFCKEYCYFCYR